MALKVSNAVSAKLKNKSLAFYLSVKSKKCVLQLYN